MKVDVFTIHLPEGLELYLSGDGWIKLLQNGRIRFERKTFKNIPLEEILKSLGEEDLYYYASCELVKDPEEPDAYTSEDAVALENKEEVMKAIGRGDTVLLPGTRLVNVIFRTDI